MGRPSSHILASYKGRDLKHNDQFCLKCDSYSTYMFVFPLCVQIDIYFIPRLVPDSGADAVLNSITLYCNPGLLNVAFYTPLMAGPHRALSL